MSDPSISLVAGAAEEPAGGVVGQTISEQTERIEHEILAPHATFASSSQGRARPEERDPLRTCFQRDRDRIVHAKAFRRLKHKTQVFVAPIGDHFTVRLTHTLEVAQIGRTIARALRLNEDLTEAIALGHDLGHTPFGHVGEDVLTELLGRRFHHAEQGIRIVDVLEGGGRGLNLTAEVRDGIRGHSWAMPSPETLEAMVVRFADRIAYLNHDMADAIRAGIVSLDDVPGDIVGVLGTSHAQRINTLVMAIVEASQGKPVVEMAPEVLHAMHELRRFMFSRVYLAPEAMPDRERSIAVIRGLFEHYRANPEQLPDEYQRLPGENDERISDYISGMTDGYAIRRFEELLG